MTIKIHFIASLYLILLAITNVRTELPKPSVSLSSKDSSDNKHPLEKIILLLGGFVIISVITLVLFKINLTDSTGLVSGIWMLMSYDSAVINSRTIDSISYTLIYLHITVAFFGLTYWIRLSVREYNNKNTRPSIDLLYEIGAWFFMLILNCTLAAVQHQNQEYKVYEWYPVALAFTSIVESYWRKGRKLRAKLLKSQLIKNMEDAFCNFKNDVYFSSSAAGSSNNNFAMKDFEAAGGYSSTVRVLTNGD
uniref:Uncharacterized protein n=1 Tax=Ipomoea trifida TaxID=35884 RepID=A0A943_IPOTF|nr:hypothetical protein [Ipomoea trifida]